MSPRGITGRPTRRFLTSVVAAASALAIGTGLTACGSDDAASSEPTSAATAQAAFPVTVTAQNGDITLTEQPDSIISLSPTATEMLFAIGAGDQVAAVDDQSSYPQDAPVTDLSGFQPNAEAVAGHDPDLVVLANDTNGIVDALDTLGIPVILLPAASKVAESYTQIGLLGAATGHVEEATAVIEQTQDRIATAIESLPADAAGMRVYHELDPTYYSVTSDTFIGDVYSMLGLSDIADAADDTAGGYPQLSAEFVVKAEPQVIVLADGTCCQQDAAAVAARPGFDRTPAVKDERVIVIDDDIASRWGPRVADFVEAVVAGIS